MSKEKVQLVEANRLQNKILHFEFTKKHSISYTG